MFVCPHFQNILISHQIFLLKVRLNITKSSEYDARFARSKVKAFFLDTIIYEADGVIMRMLSLTIWDSLRTKKEIL